MKTRPDGTDAVKASRLCRVVPCLAACMLLAACAPAPVSEPTLPPTSEVEVIPRVEADNDSAPRQLLEYGQKLHRMSYQELVRERTQLATSQKTPASRFRMAMLLGQARGPVDLARALKLLDSVQNSGESAATRLHPLARILASQYQERLKLELQNEKLSRQLKESQRRSADLQEKLNAMADIEHSIPVRPTTGKELPGAPQ